MNLEVQHHGFQIMSKIYIEVICISLMTTNPNVQGKTSHLCLILQQLFTMQMLWAFLGHLALWEKPLF